MDLHNSADADKKENEATDTAGKVSEGEATSQLPAAGSEMVSGLKEYLANHPEQVVGIVDSSDLAVTDRNNSDFVVSDPQRDLTFDLFRQVWWGQHILFVDDLDPERVVSMNPHYVPGQ